VDWELPKFYLHFALDLDALEDMILLRWVYPGMDMENLGLNVFRYRELISRLFASQGFIEYATTEPNVRMEPANVLLARIGKRVDQRVTGRFFKPRIELTQSQFIKEI